MSPFPFPTPWPVSHSADPPVPPNPLTNAELHLRLILQSLADQITRIWLSNNNTDVDLGPSMAVTARDFMVISVPSHEMSEQEKETARRVIDESAQVMTSWANSSGSEPKNAIYRKPNMLNSGAVFQHSPDSKTDLEREWEPGCQPDEVYDRVLPPLRAKIRRYLVARLRRENKWMADWQTRVRTGPRDKFFYWTALFGSKSFVIPS
jgi:hypothetical protein